MDQKFLDNLPEYAVILGPALIVALIALALAGRALRGGAGAAFLALLLALGGVLAIGGGATYGLRWHLFNRMMPACEAAQDAALKAGNAALYDCESQSLILAFPVLITIAALVFVLFGAAVMRLTRRRTRNE